MIAVSPDAITVTALDDYKLSVRFDNGETRLFDATPLLDKKCYASLRNKAFFSLARIQYGCVTWPGNMDIDPDWLYEDSEINEPSLYENTAQGLREAIAYERGELEAKTVRLTRKG